jgi:hypothetical protein
MDHQRQNVVMVAQHLDGHTIPTENPRKNTMVPVSKTSQQPENVRWIWEQSRFDVECTELSQWIKYGDAISDTSFKLPMGTSS